MKLSGFFDFSQVRLGFNIAVGCFFFIHLAHAATTIDPANAHAYGANIGWINFRGDVANGAVIGEFTCSGYIYSANCGWIHLGDGTPANGIQYQNSSATDYGVNTGPYSSDGVAFEAKLSGLAYGANIGWVNFAAEGDPRVNLATGQLLGFAYSANVGWIALSGTGVTLVTNSIAPGVDTDGDTIPDDWERSMAGNITTLGLANDADGDGRSDVEEYAAGTDPLDPSDRLRITDFVAPRFVEGIGPVATDVTWTSKPTRWYSVETDEDLLGTWQTAVDDILPTGASTSSSFNDPFLIEVPPARFYRVRARLPLAP